MIIYFSEYVANIHTTDNLLSKHFLFDQTKGDALSRIIDAMERILITPQTTTVITQGDKADYFYIIESGRCQIVKDGAELGTLGEGQSFGELALLHNSVRAATVTASPGTVLYSLDRNTFKCTVASSINSRMNEIETALHKVPLLADLSDVQIEKLAQFVEIVNYQAGVTTTTTDIDVF